MVFLGIYRALYDYHPQSDNEIALNEGDVLMVLEKSTDDDWWKAKKRASGDDIFLRWFWAKPNVK